VNQTVARCGYCGANLSLDDMRGQNCPYCHTVLAHHARAAEQAALVNQMLQQRGLAPQVPYQFGAPAPGVYLASGPQVFIQAGAPGASGAPPQDAAFPPTPVDELQRIAAEGQRRQVEFAAKARAIAEAGADDYVAIALGTHYGTAVSRAITLGITAGLVVLGTGIVLGVTATAEPALAVDLAVAGGVTAFVLFFVRVFGTPRASKSRRAGEEAWQKALPFTLTGYFEALREEPRASCHIQVHLDWASVRIPSPAIVSDLVRRCDRGATAAPGDPFGWVSGDVSGGAVRRNHQVVKYVHDLTRGVLLPLHREYPLARVALRRGW